MTASSRPPTVAAVLGVLVGLLVALTPGVASAEPVEPVFTETIDQYADYDGADTCSPTDKPGAVALKALVLAAYPGTTGYISRACDGSFSEHQEGRALDWMVSADSQSDIANDFLDWLLADDSYGNNNAMARRFGVMYIIFDHRIWRAYEPGDGWQPYSGSNPHTDHVHISMSWDGALTDTTWFTGTDVGMRLDQARFAATWRGKGRVDILRRSASGELQDRVWAGSWTGWEDLGGTLTSGPAAVWAGHRLWVFARGEGGTLAQRVWTRSLGWKPWEQTDVEITAAPGVASRGKRVDLAVLTPDATIAHRSWIPGRGWSDWEDIGGVVTAPPAVVWRSADRLDIFARSTVGKLYIRSKIDHAWAPWTDLGGFVTAGPAATSLVDGQANVFVRTSRGSVSLRSDSGAGWSAWIDIGGMHVSGPTATSVNGDRIDVFSRDRGGGLSQNFYRSGIGWSGWVQR